MSSEIFRNPTEGASARRQDLLRRRRDEFVMMPHAIRRVYVARRARSGAAIAVWLTGLGLVASALSPKLSAYVTRGMPGINPALLSTLVMAMWIIGIVAYFVARARCEHHFAVAMSKTVLPGEDLDQDVERLSHERPDDIGRGMAHALEVRSAAWPIAAAAMILPATALYVYYGAKAGGWPSIASYETAMVANAKHLALVGGLGTLAAIFMTRRSLRLPVVAPIVGVATILGGGFATVAGSWIVLAAVIGVSIAYIAARLRRERALLETDDPAAGSELFTWKGLAISVKSTVSAVAARVPRRPKVIAVGAMGVAIVYLAATRGHTKVTKVEVAQTAPTVAPKTMIVTDSGSTYKVSPTGDGAFKVDITIADDKGVDISFPGLATVPHSWTARVEVQQLGPQVGSSMTARLAGEGQQEIYGSSTTSFSASSCDDSIVPLSLHIAAAAGTYSLRVTPVLEPAGC